jgi:hypothetical protein
MEPRREQPTPPNPGPEEKRKRFRLVRLEERIAPGGKGPKHTHDCGTALTCDTYCTTLTYSIE